MISTEDILKQKFPHSLSDKYFNNQLQAYIHYTNRTLSDLIQQLYDEYGKISPMEIEEREQVQNKNYLSQTQL